MKTSTKVDQIQKVLKQKQNETQFLKLVIFYLVLLAGMFVTVAAGAQATGDKYFNNLNGNGVILDQYDAVAFFTDNKPLKGDAAFQYKYQDATYYFASQEHLDLFKNNPEKYKPQFGGWCAYAVSLGRVAPVNVNTFSIVDNRLLLQHNDQAVKRWNKDVTGNLVKADKYWPEVSSGHGAQVATDEEKSFLNNEDKAGLILEGYDAVGYFTDNKATKGEEKYSVRYNGATYWFASEPHAAMFRDHPEMFAPAYGAFCGYAMSLNKLRPIDPEIFDVINGRLILQHSMDAYNKFHASLMDNIAKADNYWPKKVAGKGGKKIEFDEAAK